MIFKVTQGSDMGHLVRYLFNEQSGPDKANEHTDCRAVAAEDGVDVPLGRQLSKVEQSELAGALTVSSDLYGTQIGDGNVWHVALSTKGGADRDLTDDEWADVARTVVSRLGFAGPGVADPCAWVAVRHGKSANGNDHLHVAVNLIRQGGQAASIHRLFPKLGAACAEMEARYGLTVVEGRTLKAGMPGLTRSEVHKAARVGKTAPERVEVARAVRAAAVGSRTEDEFVRRLRAAGVAVKPRYDRSGMHRVVGYSVAQQPADGEVAVFFAGGSLAKDLTLPALRKGWEPAADGGQEAAAEWGRYRDPAAVSDEIAPDRYRTYGWGEAAGEWGPGRTPASAGGRESEVYDAGQWAVAATRLAGVVRDLAAVPASDETAWQAAAQGAAGLLAGMSGRLEPTPGPLARAADVLARSAQPTGRTAGPAVRQVGSGTMRTVTAVMAQAQITDEVALAWRLMLAELLRLAQAIAQAHVARGEAAQAARLAGDARTALEQARAHYGSSQRVAEMIPALVDALGGDRERDDDRPGPKKRKTAGSLRPEDYAAITARQRTHHPKPAAEADR